jgi:excisionase family DNA binding protein
MKKTKLTNLEYPIVLKKVMNELVISIPDMGHWTSLKMEGLNSSNSANAENGEFELTDEWCQKLLEKIKQSWVYIENHKQKKKWVPNPSTFRQSLQKPENEDYTLPDFVKALSQHMSVSENTIRREIKRGKIQCYITEGGHRRIPFAELELYLARADSRQEPALDV